MNNEARFSKWAAVIGAVTAVAPAVFAQEPAGEERAAVMIEEVVVTAMRREQNLQEVPSSISVMEASTINAKAAQDYRDYLTTVPGINFTEGNLGQTLVTIRGVSDGLGATSPLTGIYFDETPVTQSFVGTFDPNVFDLDRVEVLRGPQGTLYGASAMGGTVRLVTNKPDLELFEGAIEGRYGFVEHGDANWLTNGVVNVPLVEGKLGLRVSGGIRRDGGWIDDALRHSSDENSIDKDNARLQLRFDPSDRASLILGYLYQEDDYGAPSYRDRSQPKYTTHRAYKAHSFAETDLTTLTFEYDWDNANLTAATSYMDRTIVSGQDSTTSLSRLVSIFFPQVELGSDEGLGVDTSTEFTLLTQEIRLASTGTNRLDWLVGLYYSKDEADIAQQFDFAQAPSLEPFASGLDFYDSLQSYDTEQIAAFGELTYHLTDRVSLTAGYRVSEVEKDDGNVTYGFLGDGVPIVQDSDESSLTQKYAVDYQVTDDQMVYVQAAEGYRNGGPTGAGIPPGVCDDDLAALGYSSKPSSYDPDDLWSYELGSKNHFFDGRMTLNAAAYYTDWSDMQTSIPLASCGFVLVANAGQSEIKGADLEASFLAADGLTLSGSLSYVDAVLTDAAPGTTSRDGDALPLTAEWSGNLVARYDFSIFSGLMASLRAELNYVGPRWNMFPSNVEAIEIDSYTTVSARAEVLGNGWTLALYGTNITDEYVVTNISSPQSYGYDTEAMPRTIGVEARYSF